MKTHSPLFLHLAQNVKSQINEIDVHQVKILLENNSNNTLIIDVRENHEWESGHLPQAIHLSKGILERDIEKNIPNVDTPLILYCSGGFRSAIAADNLQKMGYKNVSSMLGGTSAWIQAGYGLNTTW